MTALEDFLTNSFDGCLVTVSHDRFFMDEVAEHLFVFQGDGKVGNFNGIYSEYLDYRQHQESAVKVTKATNNKASKSKAAVESNAASAVGNTAPALGKKSSESKTGGLTFQQRKQLQKVEKDMNKASSRVKELEQLIDEKSRDAVGYSELNELTQTLFQVQDKHKALEEQWMQLMELDEL